MLKKIANTIRSLTMDSVERAGSGHPGLPMGCAELGAALILSRQPLAELNRESSVENALKGAYILQAEKTSHVEYLLIATGSEVHLALEVAEELGPSTRVVSMPSWELFEKQSDEYKQSLLQGELKVSIEAGIEQGWHKYIGGDGISIAISKFGECGSIQDLKNYFGYTKSQIVSRILQKKGNLCASV